MTSSGHVTLCRIDEVSKTLTVTIVCSMLNHS